MTSLSNKQVQKMLQKLSPQQIQMIKLLELPTIQFEQRIKQEIEENPALDEKEPETEPEEETPQTKYNIDDYVKREDIPAYKLYANNYSKDDKRGTIPLSDGLSYNEYLEEQLNFKGLSTRKNIIGKYLIGSLDNDGYLRRELSSICDDIAFSLGIETTEKELEEMLCLIQTFEPYGTGARNLQEALILQLKHHPQTTEVKLAIKVLEQYFNDFAKKHFDKIIQRLGIDEDTFRKVVDTIKGLSPKPANQYIETAQSEPTIQIIPDFILEYNNGELELSLNKYNMPDIKINNSYIKMLEEIAHGRKRNNKYGGSDDTSRTADKHAAQFIKQKIDSARWFISAIKQRNATLLLTMHTIIEFQKEYFIEGDETKLRPMILRDIADITGLDVSTISRVVNSKYIQTHFGIYPLKYFFSEAMQTNTGEEVSSREIKKILSDCVAQEEKRKPLTDEALMIILKEKGYQIARRTVAKYREMLGIPVARLRKQF